MTRAEDQSIHAVSGSLSEVNKSNIREQLLNYLKELRQFIAPGSQAIDGGLLDDSIIGRCFPVPTCKKIGFTTEK
jgi:hypothetical protein